MLQDTSTAHPGLLLLGPPQAIRAGRSITGFRSSKAQALLYFLAVTGRSQRRSTLSALLWPEADEKQAGASLRNALSNLRALIGDCLTITRETAHLHRERLALDVAQFEALLARTGDMETDIQQMEAAASLYRGDFLEGFHLPDAPEFEQWATIERERLRRTVLNALLTLAEWHAGQADFAAGLEDLDRLLAIDPTNEVGHRQKMIALARLGQRSAALQQYQACRRILAEELGVDPSPETAAVYQLVLAGALEGQPQGADDPLLSGPGRPRNDQREMPGRIAFYGRQADLERLSRWLTTDEVGLAAITGLGGVGKTTLAVELLARLPPASFDCVLWRSLVNAPKPDTLLDDWLQIVAGPHLDRLPEGTDDKLAMLFDELQRQRCLLILDNLESVIEAGDRAGCFRAGYEGYGQLIARMGRGRHRSCLLFTSRDLPTALRSLEEDTPRVRILPLEGLPPAPGVRLLRDRGVSAPDSSLETLVERYSGNPLALKLAADTVRDLFGSDVGAFLGDETPVFDDIRRVLDEQVGRLSELGREIAAWLAIERQPVSAQTLWDDLARKPRRAEFLETMRSLQNSSLVEAATDASTDGGARLALQNVVMEYLTERLVGALSREIEGDPLFWLHRYAIVKAQSEEHVQASQRHLLLEPIARQLVDARGRSGAVAHLHELLSRLHHEVAPAASYAAANILHLLLHLEADLNGWDFSRLTIRQADLRTDRLSGVDLRGADLRESAFSGTFGLVRALAITADGRYLAAGTSEGGVFVWRLADLQPHLVLRGHRQPVSSVAFAPDGATLVSGGYDGRICVWDLSTGSLLAGLDAHTDTIGGVAFSPDGALIASGGSDHQLIVWDWRSGQIRRRLQESASVDCIVFNPDGRLLACAKEDAEARIWDWRTETPLQTLRGHTDKVRAVAFHPHGSLIATGGEDKRICLWQLEDPHAVRTLEGHAGWVCALAFSPDGRQLASASADHTIRLWDVASGQIRRTLIGHTGWAFAVAFSPDGKTVASGGYDQTIRLWEEDTGRVLRLLHGHGQRIDLVIFSPDGTLLASSGLGGPLHVWDVGTRRHLHKLTGHGGAIRAVAISRNNQLVAGGCDDRRVYLWKVEDGALKQALLGHTDLVRFVGFSPDDRLVVSGSHDGTLRVWETASGQLRAVLPGAVARIQSAAAFSPDGSLLAYACNDGTVKLWDAASGMAAHTLAVAEGAPMGVAFDPQGQQLACGTDRGTVCAWEVHTARPAPQIRRRFCVQPEVRTIWRIFFSPDGRYLAVCYDGGRARILDAATGEGVYTLPNAGGAFNLAFVGAGQYLAAGVENAIALRQSGTWEVRRTLEGHLSEVTSLDGSPCGQLAASSSADGSVRLWSLESGEPLATLAPEGPYAGMNIAGVTGITAAQRATLVALGAM